MAFVGEGSRVPRGRAAGLVCLAVLTVVWISYIAQAVPIRVHTLPEQLAPRMTGTAVTALLLMLAVDAVIVIAVLWQQRRGSVKPAGKRPASEGIPAAPLPREVGVRTLCVTALASSTVVFGSALLGLPLWAIGLMALLPWFPLYVFGASWQYRHYGAFALFGTLVLLQLGHLSEHVVQNLQLLLTHGRLAASRGVFGQLDVEAVHFYWNIGIWLGTGALLYRYGLGNVWLTVAFVAASLHSVEHMYLYWLYVTHSSAYLMGGWNGILGQGGLVGSPLARPYLHLVYNVIEVTPFVLAYYDQSRLIFNRSVARPPAETAVSITGCQ
jgi:hypothetical protein